MLRRFVIENLGRLRQTSTPANDDCGKLTLVFAPNGYGKTTISATLRASEAGDAAALAGRQTLGNGSAAPRVVLEFDANTSTFQGGAWCDIRPQLSIFDGSFIAENVHAAEAISLDNRRSMFSVVLGRDGLALYEAERAAVANATAAQRREAAAKTALAEDLPLGMREAEFLALQPDATLDAQVVAAEARLTGVRQIDGMRRLPMPAPLPPVEDLGGAIEALGTAVPGVAPDVGVRLTDHKARFGFDEKGERWLMYGARHLHNDDCPFCARPGVDEAGMLSVYRSAFSEQYLDVVRAVSEAKGLAENSLGEPYRQLISDIHAHNLASITAWAAFFDIGAPLGAELAVREPLADALRTMIELLVQKEGQPSVALALGAAEEVLNSSTTRAQRIIDEYNSRVNTVREAMAARLRAAEGDTEAAAQANLNNLRKLRARLDPGVDARCVEFREAGEAKRAADAQKERVRAQLRDAVDGNTRQFEERVNSYLRRFNASFDISSIAHAFPGGAGSTGYALRIRGETVDANHNHNPANPGFKNTLSTGDKTTLALAFFLAKLDGEADLIDRTIVFDDPFSSHDRFRQSRTIQAISLLLERCAQVIVLSHDEFFLREVYTTNGRHPRTVYELRLDQDSWAVIETGNLNRLNMLGQEQRIADIRGFVDRDVGDEDTVALYLRQTLEHRYRNAFPGLLGPTEMLGNIVDILSRQGTAHESAGEVADLRLINVETRGDHHAEDRAHVVQHRWDRENLRGLARDTLRLTRA